MRTVTVVTLEGKPVDMPPTWNAIKRVGTRVQDPWELAYRAFANQGELLFTSAAAAEILQIGLTEAGEDVTLDQAGKLVLALGMERAARVVGDYITALVEGSSEYAQLADKDTKKK